MIVADDSGCGEVVGKTAGGQVVPIGSVEALASAIDAVLNAPGSWRARAAESWAHIRNAYSEERVCEQLEELYLGMVA